MRVSASHMLNTLEARHLRFQQCCVKSANSVLILSYVEMAIYVFCEIACLDYCSNLGLIRIDILSSFFTTAFMILSGEVFNCSASKNTVPKPACLVPLSS